MEGRRLPLILLPGLAALLAGGGCHSPESGGAGVQPAPQAVSAAAAPAALDANGAVEIDVDLPGFREYPLKARAYPDSGDCLTWYYSDAPYAVLAKGYRREHHVVRRSVRLLRDPGSAQAYASSYTFFLTSDESPELVSRLTAAVRAAIESRREAGLPGYAHCPADGRIRLVPDYLAGDLRVEPAGAVTALQVESQARMGESLFADLRPLVLELDATDPAAEPAAARAFVAGGARMHIADLVALGGVRGASGIHRFPVLIEGMRPTEIEWTFVRGLPYNDARLRSLRDQVLCARSVFELSRARFAGFVEAPSDFLVPVGDPDCDGDQD